MLCVVSIDCCWCGSLSFLVSLSFVRRCFCCSLLLIACSLQSVLMGVVARLYVAVC